MKFIRILLALMVALIGWGHARADSILVLSSGGWNTVPVNLESALTGMGHTVTVQTMQPASIDAPSQSASGYDQVWVFGTIGAGWDQVQLRATLMSYLSHQGAVYLQSEVGCCDTSAAFAQDLMNATVSPSVLTAGAASIVHSINLDGAFSGVLNTALAQQYAGAMVCSGISYDGNAYRQTENVQPAYQLVSTASGVPVAFFDQAAMQGNAGRLLVNGDINYLLQGGNGVGGPIIQPAGMDVVRLFANVLGDIKDYPTCLPVAVADSLSTVAGATTPSVLLNDYFQYPGVAATDANVVTTPVGAVPAGLTLQANGTMNVDPSVAPGTYTVEYQICRVGAPTECSTARATLTVRAPMDPTAVPTLDLGALALLMALVTGIGVRARRRASAD